MEQLKKETDGSSLNLVDSYIEQLKTLFPEVVSEGKVDFDKLRQTLGDAVESQEERYNFSWNGKVIAKRIAQMQSTGTLRPVERVKNDCGRQHFKALEVPVKFMVADNFGTFRDRVAR